jgi:hypothetical protein
VSSSNPLTSAVTSGDEKAVSALLANGADVNERTSGGQTPLILAVIFGRTNIVRLLVNAGADPGQRDNLGLNAIDWAQRRGLNEAVEILTSKPQPSTPPASTPPTSTPPRRILINLEEPEQSVAEQQEPLSDSEKSNRWLAGLKQRLDEQAARRTSRNEAPLSIINPPEPEPLEDVEPVQSQRAEPEVVETKPVAPEPPPKIVHSTRILTPPPTPPTTGKRKRCPQCNAIYNSDLLAYCAHHIVALVDDDDPVNTQPPPPPSKANPPLFWIMVIITLTGSVIIGSLITTYLYKTNQAAARVAGEQQAPIQKGMPEVGGELVGRAVLLPEAQCPVIGTEPVSGTVTVSIMVDKNGQVQWARGSGGDWLMRGAATEAAMKSTFAPEKLRRRETEGTITYTFK